MQAGKITVNERWKTNDVLFSLTGDLIHHRSTDGTSDDFRLEQVSR